MGERTVSVCVRTRTVVVSLFRVSVVSPWAQQRTRISVSGESLDLRCSPWPEGGPSSVPEKRSLPPSVSPIRPRTPPKTLQPPVHSELDSPLTHLHK